MSWLERQSFLGDDSDSVLDNAVVGIAGLGGGGSHAAQQLAHVGVGTFVLLDHDEIEDRNLNRLVGGRAQDVVDHLSKFEIARRLITGVNPRTRVLGGPNKWEASVDHLKTCDLVIGGLDSVKAKHELEGFCRRFLMPYVDMGMDVHQVGERYLIAGQVALSMPGKACLRCLGIVTDARLTKEGRRYGAAGGRPQVVWPNGILGSAAVGIAVRLLTPWFDPRHESAYLEYDGNKGTLQERPGIAALFDKPCPHYLSNETGDPGFDVRRAFAVPS